MARGRIMKIMTSIMKDMTTCIAYDENTIMSEKRAILSVGIPAASIRMAPIQ